MPIDRISGDTPGNPRTNALLFWVCSADFDLQQQERAITTVRYITTIPKSANPTQTQFIHVGHGLAAAANKGSSVTVVVVVLVSVLVVVVTVVVVIVVLVFVVSVVEVTVVIDVDVFEVVVDVSVSVVVLVCVAVVIVCVVAVRVVAVLLVAVVDVAVAEVVVLVVVVDVVVIFSVQSLPFQPAWQAHTTSVPPLPSSDASHSPCPHGFGLHPSSRVSQYFPSHPPLHTHAWPNTSSSMHEIAFSYSELMQGSEVVHVGCSQRSPTKPSAHSHVKLVMAPMHSPPFKHAFSCAPLACN